MSAAIADERCQCLRVRAPVFGCSGKFAAVKKTPIFG
jgi:hypothetical protein